MIELSGKDVSTILLGTELGGRQNIAYDVQYAVPKRLLEVERGMNKSAFSFGIVQLDIGSNTQAKAAYSEMLDNAFAAGAISDVEFGMLSKYNGKFRYDLDSELKAEYQNARQLLQDKVMPRPESHEIIDRYTAEYLDGSVVPEVNKFFASMHEAYGDDSVFNANHPDFHEAVTTVVSIKNRFGNLKKTTEHFLENKPGSVDDMSAWFEKMLPKTHAEDWELIKIGAKLFEEAGLGDVPPETPPVEVPPVDEAPVEKPAFAGVEKTATITEAAQQLEMEDGTAVMEAYLKSKLGHGVNDVKYTGADGAAFIVSDFKIDGKIDTKGGIFLSTGGYPGSANGDKAASFTHGTQGDADLEATLRDAGYDSTTRDAAVLEFDVDVTGSEANVVSFDIVFGSEEFDAKGASEFVDAAAIYVNGENISLINGDPKTPLSVTEQNQQAGLFNDNSEGEYTTEWDGFTNTLTVKTKLQDGENTVKIAVADNSDGLFDSGLYVADIELEANRLADTAKRLIDKLPYGAAGDVDSVVADADVLPADDFAIV